MYAFKLTRTHHSCSDSIKLKFQGIKPSHQASDKGNRVALRPPQKRDQRQDSLSSLHIFTSNESQ